MILPKLISNIDNIRNKLENVSLLSFGHYSFTWLVELSLVLHLVAKESHDYGNTVRIFRDVEFERVVLLQWQTDSLLFKPFKNCAWAIWVVSVVLQHKLQLWQADFVRFEFEELSRHALGCMALEHLNIGEIGWHERLSIKIEHGNIERIVIFWCLSYLNCW